MITISHEPNDRLKLGRSTDTFRVSEPIMLNAIRPGAHIRFAADRISGQLTIAKISPIDPNDCGWSERQRIR